MVSFFTSIIIILVRLRERVTEEIPYRVYSRRIAHSIHRISWWQAQTFIVQTRHNGYNGFEEIIWHFCAKNMGDAYARDRKHMAVKKMSPACDK